MSKFIELNGEIYKRIDDIEGEKPSIKPEEGEEYWLINDRGLIYSDDWDNNITDKARYEIGNVYSGKYVREKVEELKAIQRVKEYIIENFGYHPEKWADWNNRHQNKYDIIYKSKDGVDYCWCTTAKYYSPIGYLKTEEQAKQLIEDKKEDLETIYKPK